MRSRRIAAAVAGAAVLSLVLAACGTTVEPDSTAPVMQPSRSRELIQIPAELGQVDVLPQWVSGRELSALDALAATLESRYDGAVTFRNQMGVKDSWDNDIDYLNGIGTPLDALSTQVGQGGVDDVAAGRLQSADGLYQELALADVWPDKLYDQIALDGALYAMPVLVVRTNLLWENRDIVKKEGLDPDATYASVDDWIGALDKLRDAGVQPIVIGAAWSQLLLLNLLLADLGPQGYRDLWDGRGDWGSAEVTRALDQLRAILDLANGDRDELGLPEMAHRVGKGKAAFMVMGDWAREQLDDHERVDGKDYRVDVMPGTAGSFSFSMDAFGWGAHSPHAEQARAWFETVSSADGQSAVAHAMGTGIPVRTDVDPAPFTDIQRTAMADWRTDEIVGSTQGGGLLAPEAHDKVSEAISRFADGQLSASELQEAFSEVTQP